MSSERRACRRTIVQIAACRVAASLAASLPIAIGKGLVAQCAPCHDLHAGGVHLLEAL